MSRCVILQQSLPALLMRALDTTWAITRPVAQTAHCFGFIEAAAAQVMQIPVAIATRTPSAETKMGKGAVGDVARRSGLCKVLPQIRVFPRPRTHCPANRRTNNIVGLLRSNRPICFFPTQRIARNRSSRPGPRSRHARTSSSRSGPRSRRARSRSSRLRIRS